MKKPKLIIVEGAQGSGKGTITNILREKIPCTTLMRLSGIKDKSMETGLSKVKKLRQSELELILCSKECETNYVLDRSFMSEKVYCNLGYKEYDFQKEYDFLCEILNTLSLYYNIHFIVLKADETEFEDRLKRDKTQYEHSKFSIENSIKQQEEYIQELELFKKKYPNMKCHAIENNKEPNCVFELIKRVCEL